MSGGSLAPRERLEALFRCALRAVDPERAVDAAVSGAGDALRIADRPVPPAARLFVLAAGKAAVPMARAFAARAGARIAAGLAVTRDAEAVAPPPFETHAAGHPLPDARSARAGARALALAGRAGPGDAFVVLLSGGASALLTTPLPGLALEDLRRTTGLLLRAGAPIEALNAVRKHLTGVSGGRLAAACAAPVLVLTLSDVLGDDPATIASGPCAGDVSSYADAERALREHGVLDAVPAAVRAHLEAGVRGEREETVRPGSPSLARVHGRILASNRDALAAAREAAEASGLRAQVVTPALSGEARSAGARLGALLRAVAPGPPATLLLAGGETTVTVRGDGRGGRCQELALAAALVLAGAPDVALLAAGTDGSDGPTDAAGAFADGSTVARGAARGLDAAACLRRNDAYGFFAGEGGLLRTGPTGTNVMDLVLALRGAVPDAG